MTLLFVVTNYYANGQELLTDIDEIQKYWSGQRAYRDTPEDGFGVKDTGLPDGCQVEQLQIFHRHSIRYPSSDENAYITALNTKIKAAQNLSSSSFTGPLSFINKWSLQLSSNVLNAAGVSVAYDSGVLFWKRYGRLLYDAVPGQTSYNATGQKKPVLRASTLPRVLDTAKIWAQGFFGPNDATDKHTLLEVPFVTTQNSSLSSFMSCTNYGGPIGIGGGILAPSQAPITATLPYYLNDTVDRLKQYMSTSMNLTVEDVFAMQALCQFEFYGIGSSDFCNLFTLDEWKGFNYVYDSFMYNRASFGNPGARAVGIGFLQEILARLQGQYINSSETSINSTLDSDPETFPLDQKVYLDVTNDFMVLGTVTAMSLDYFKGPLPLVYPRPDNRTFQLTKMTQYGGRLTVEKIGCTSANPTAKSKVTQYTNDQYGYSPDNATFKFVRFRMNMGILPLSTIRGGLCDIEGRTDGLCPLDKFVESQANATTLANYQYVCFGNFTYDPAKFQGDGTYFE